MFSGESSVNARDRTGGDYSLDEDQEKEYDKIIEYLIVGGYFRARIQTLSRFDKVVGGMAWCITASNEDLDVDIFFQEDASIGQRLKIAEGIVRALQRMKYPYTMLEPNQIQGGSNTQDFKAIFPVVQWLVKKVIETRKEFGDLMRQFTESQFAKTHILPEEAQFEQKKEKIEDFYDQVADRYKPERKFKRPGRRVPYLNRRTNTENIQLTLVEYGAAVSIPTLSGKQDDKKMQELEEAMKLQNANLRKNMASVSSGKDVSTGALEQFLPQNIDEFDLMYQDRSELDPIQAQKVYGMRLHEQNVNNLEKQIGNLRKEMQSLEVVYNEMDQKLEEARASHAAKLAYNQRIISEIEKLDAMETPENTKVLQLLKNLVQLNEDLRSQESKFKANCKRQLADLKGRIAQLENENSASGRSEEDQRIEATFQDYSNRLAQFKQLASHKNREIASLERQLDEVPSRIELSQYQRQFVELYEQMASKETETRQYFNTYNTSDKTKSFLQSELGILNSIHDNYTAAMASKSTRDQLVSQMVEKVKSVAQNLEKVFNLNSQLDFST
eukprot:TRINITY_DN8079_c1_g1_i1.p1 TRINITY_DN8079_c1_g1~~TRINITY_DN8079_c1_g1_i1.p1  ORF type:complete len:557 (-),score=194.43 TRINITY_DN8079_c1_g1_i1:279-1949(-)